MGTWLAKLLPSEGGSFLEEGIGGNPGPRMRGGAEMPHQPTLSPLLCHDGSDSCSYLNPSLGNFAAAACNTACTGQKKKKNGARMEPRPSLQPLETSLFWLSREEWGRVGQSPAPALRLRWAC